MKKLLLLLAGLALFTACDLVDNDKASPAEPQRGVIAAAYHVTFQPSAGTDRPCSLTLRDQSSGDAPPLTRVWTADWVTSLQGSGGVLSSAGLPASATVDIRLASSFKASVPVEIEAQDKKGRTAQISRLLNLDCSSQNTESYAVN